MAGLAVMKTDCDTKFLVLGLCDLYGQKTANGSQRNGSNSLPSCKIYKGRDNVTFIFMSPALEWECSKLSKIYD